MAKARFFWRAELSELESIFRLSTIQEELRDVCGRSRPLILALASCSLRLANEAVALHATIKKKNFHDWLQQALMKGARAAHRITTYDTKPQEPVKEMVVEGRVRVEPMEVMEERA